MRLPVGYLMAMTLAEMVRAIGPRVVVDTFFDVSVTGQITWADDLEGDREIWSAQVPERGRLDVACYTRCV